MRYEEPAAKIIMSAPCWEMSLSYEQEPDIERLKENQQYRNWVSAARISSGVLYYPNVNRKRKADWDIEDSPSLKRQDLK